MSSAADKPSADKASPITVTVKVMGKEYDIACPPNEHEALVASAEHLNERMQAIKKRGRVVDAERVAVLAALNLAREKLAAEGNTAVLGGDEVLARRLQQLGRDIDGAMDDPSA